MDKWRLLYAVTLLSLVGVVSSSAVVASALYYPRLALVATLALVTVSGSPKRTAPLGPASELLLFGLWATFFVAAASTAWSVAPAETFAHVLLLGCLVVVVHGVLARRWSTGEDALADLAVAYRVLALAAVASFVAVLAGLPGAVNPFTGRSHGIYNNPNMMGMLGVMGFLIGLALLYRKVSWLRLASVAALGGSVLMSQSRTALLAVAVALVWLLLARTRAKHTVVLIYFGSLAALTWAFMRELVRAPLPTPDLSVFGRFDATTEGGALNGRDAIWVVVLDLWRDSPILGTGYGTAPIVTPQVLTEFAVGRELTSAHNGYLQWLLETGALGAVLLSIALISALRSALMVGRSSWASALGGAVLAGLLIQAGESALLGTGQPFPYLFWLVAAACAAALDGHSAVDSGHQPDRDGRKLSSVNPARPVPSRLR